MSITDYSSQRPVIDIVAPALTRHVSFRLLKRDNPRFAGGDEDEVVDQGGGKVRGPTTLPDEAARLAALDRARGARAKKWDEFLREINGHLATLWRSFAENHGSPPTIANPYRFNSAAGEQFNPNRSAVITMPTGENAGFRVRVRFDVYNEAYTLTYIIDEIDVARDRSLSARLSELMGAGAGTSDDPRSAAVADAALSWLYDGFWEDDDGTVQLCRDIQDWVMPPAHEGSKDGPPRRGSLLADFRGIVIHPTTAHPASKPDIRFSAVTAPAEPRLSPALIDYLNAHEGVVRAATGRIDTAKARTPRRRPLPAAGEPVLCGMAGGEALYLAVLGKETARAVEPVRHMLVYAGRSPTQIGRLVRRLHILGEFRHAALLDYDNANQWDLKSVSRAVRELGSRVDQEMAHGPDSDLIARINVITAEVGLLRANEDKMEGGVRYRIEQSRYYANEFTKTVPHLRSVRIAGYQTYDEFVARYIYQLFGRIDRLGTRYDALLRRLNLLMTFSLAQSISAYQSDVRGTLRELRKATEGLRSSSRAQTNVAHRQRSLLDEAGKIAYLFATYYVGSVLHYAYEEIKRTGTIGWFNAIWSIVTLIMTVWIGIIVFRGKRREGDASELPGGAESARIGGEAKPDDGKRDPRAVVVDQRHPPLPRSPIKDSSPSSDGPERG